MELITDDDFLSVAYSYSQKIQSTRCSVIYQNKLNPIKANMIIPKNLYYTKNHLWLRKIGLCDFCIGITDFAQKEIGEIDLIELNVVEKRLVKSASWGVIYGTNATFSLIAPCELKITTMNTILNTHPSQVNLDPYNFWFLSISTNISTHEFLTHEEYLKLIQ